MNREETQIEMKKEKQHQQQHLKKSANSMRRLTGDTINSTPSHSETKEVKFMSFVKKIEDIGHSVPANVENSEVIRHIVSGEKKEESIVNTNNEVDKKSIAFTTSEEHNQDEVKTNGGNRFRRI